MTVEPIPLIKSLRSDTEPRPDAEPRPGVLIGLMVGALVLFAIYYKFMFHGLTNADALDFAQIGRNISAGRGFTTYIIRPLALISGASPQSLPDSTHGPLYPFLLALIYVVGGGAKDSLVALLSGLFYILTVPIIYLLGTRLFSRRVGAITAGIFAVNALDLEYAVSGLHITFYTFLTGLLFLNLQRLAAHAYRDSEKLQPIPRASIALCGTLCGLLYLADPVFLWLTPLVFIAVMWLCPDFRQTALTLFLVPAVVLMLPWMIRNQLVAGNALFGMRASEVWMNTSVYPGSSAYRMLPDEFIPGGQVLRSVLNKFISGANQIIQIFPQLSIGWLLLFFLPCLLHRFGRESVSAMRSITLLCLAGVAFGTLLFSVQMPLFVSLVPPMLVFSVGYLTQLVATSELTAPAKRLLNGFIIFLLVCPLFTDLFLTERTPILRSTETAKGLVGQIALHAALLSDQPWIPAWYADRPAIWLPNTDARVADLRQHYPEIKWLFLTEQSRSYSPTWQYVYDILYRWTLVAAETKQTGGTPPRPFVVSGKGQPLLTALTGFVALPPNQEQPTVVIAALPEAVITPAPEAKPDAKPETKPENAR